MKRKKSKFIHPLIKAQIRAKWSGEAVKAQIHALMGDDKEKLLAFASVLFFVASGCASFLAYSGDEPDFRIIRGAVNQLDDLNARSYITEQDRGAILAGMNAAKDIIDKTPIDVVDEAAVIYAQMSQNYHKG